VDSAAPAREPGPLDSLRALGATLVALLGTRAELLVVELREEGERRKEMLLLAGVAGVFLMVGLILAALFVIFIFWEEHRVAASGIVTAVYLGIGAWAVAKLKAKARASPPPFEATLAELAKDLEMLRSRGE
jgi:uncharacterized membrane protein YqjE